MKRITKFGVALALAAAGTSIAYAQMKPEDAIRARQSIMRVVALNFGPVAQMAGGKMPWNKDAFVASALRLEAVWSMNPGRFFPAGSDKAVAGAKIASFTEAAPAIWSKPDDYKKAMDANGQAIAALAAAARSGDEGKMKAAVGDVGKACKACHDDFRAK